MIGPDHCYVLYMCHIHTLLHSLQLPSGAECHVPSVSTQTPKVMDTAMYSEVCQSQKVHVHVHVHLSGSIHKIISMLVNTVLDACHHYIQIVPLIVVRWPCLDAMFQAQELFGARQLNLVITDVKL